MWESESEESLSHTRLSFLRVTDAISVIYRTPWSFVTTIISPTRSPAPDFPRPKQKRLFSRPAFRQGKRALARTFQPFSSLCRLLSEQVGLLAETVRPFFTWFFLRHLAKATVFVVLL